MGWNEDDEAPKSLLELPTETPKEKCEKYMQSIVGTESGNDNKLENSRSTNSIMMKQTLAYLQLVFAKTVEKQGENEQCAEYNVVETSAGTETLDVEQHGIRCDTKARLSHNNSTFNCDEKIINEKKRQRGRKKSRKKNITVNELSLSNNDAHEKIIEIDLNVDQNNKEKRIPKSDKGKYHKQKNNGTKDNSLNPPKSVNKHKRTSSEIVHVSTRRQSMRLSSHPPGHFQTKPAMILYIEPASNYKSKVNKRSRSLCTTNKKQPDFLSPSQCSLPIIKRRKLYNPNGEDNNLNRKEYI